jgi:pimeloyl-ACP methyl ester carboxylesterase
MEHISVGDAKLAVSRRGEKGYALLLVHGFPLDHTIWQPQIDYFSDHCRVIAVDLRGFGNSDVTPGTVTMEQMADDLERLLSTMLHAKEQVIFCGLSMGGYVGWQFWRKYKHRVRAMISCDTRAVPDSPEAAAGRAKLAETVLKQGSVAAADVMLPKMFAPNTAQSQQKLAERVRFIMERQKPEGIAAALHGMAARPDARDLLTTIDVPSLVIVGDHDTISTPAEMRQIADAMPDSEWVSIPDAGHLACLENPTVVNNAIAEFILQ